MNRPRLLGISGSLRRESYGTAVLASLAEAIAPDAELVLHPLNDVPLYDQDLDDETPPAGVAALRRAIIDADGVIVVSPEYNYGMSGVLKNALDWASRPYGQSAFNGKPVLTATASPASTGGVRAQSSLNETITAIGGRLLQRPQIVIGAVHEKVADGRLVDEGALGFLQAGVDDLLQALRAELRAAA